MTTFYTQFKSCKIMIPRLQREYVQGLSEGIISTLLDKLLDINNRVDLNYIYGYRKDGYFIPVDGQQRLTTLWLLHTYLAIIVQETPPASIEFYNREFAKDFCSSLIKDNHLLDAIKKSKANLNSLYTTIVDEYWFISSWLTNTSVRGMLLTLNYIQEKTKAWNDTELKTLWYNLTSDTCHIIFDFLEMTEENKLKDDIYIKMNGRGRPLTSFENLKSWIDERIKIAVEKNILTKEWAESWKSKMDNEWTALFWKNRNRNQTNPQEIDDEQEACFTAMLLIYWIKKEQVLKNKILSLCQCDSDQIASESLLDIYGITNNAKDDNSFIELVNQIITRIFDELSRGTLPQLIWLERLELMPDDFLHFAYESLETINKYSNELNNSELYLSASVKEVKPIYDLCMTSSSYGRTLPLLYALLACNKYGCIEIYQWMRLMRNLILNTTIERKDDKILKVFDAIDSFAKEIGSYNILDYITNNKDNFKNILSVFASTQLSEEIVKADVKYRNLLPQMYKLENSSFFRGKIGCIFDLLDSEDSIHNMIGDYACLLTTIFNSSGLNNIFDKDGSFYFRRALVLQGKSLYGIKTSSGYSFCKDADQWRTFVNDKKSIGFSAFKSLLSDLVYYKNNGKNWADCIYNNLEEKIESVSKDFDKLIDNYEGDTNWLYFVHHIGLWHYMENDMTYTLNGDNVYLKPTSNARRSVNIRTYALYLDCCYKPEMKEVNKFWVKPNIWQYSGSCVYYNLPIGDYLVCIDIIHNNQTKDRFYFSSYIKHCDEVLSGDKSKEFYISNNCNDIIEEYKCTIADNRLNSSNLYSYNSMLNVLINILVKIPNRLNVENI